VKNPEEIHEAMYTLKYTVELYHQKMGIDGAYLCQGTRSHHRRNCFVCQWQMLFFQYKTKIFEK